MRILQVRFKNLNSLVGEWEIDLTHPAFASDGIFAITGPTGAGKTTILDAICLALYGRTPRLNKISKSGNEIMSRQTGECFAEVTFETQTGHFRCHWSQHRARKKPDGELQAPKQEIANADSGQILETKILEVAKRIEMATGMDFDRFTRSMLLAQGGFAVFLQASPDERAPILEQITGTKIYSQISIRVHERQREKREKLNLLNAEISGIVILDPELEKELQKDLEAKQKQESELVDKSSETGKAITWLNTINDLKKEIHNLTDEADTLHSEIEAFKPEQYKLERSRKAASMDVVYATLAALRKQHSDDQAALIIDEVALPELENSVNTNAESLKSAEQHTLKAKEDLKVAAPLIQRIRSLDQRLAEQNKAVLEDSEKCIKHVTKIEADKQAREKKQENRLKIEKILEDVEGYLKEHAQDEWLISGLAGIEEQFGNLVKIQKDLAQKEADFKKADIALVEAIKKLDNSTKQCAICKQELEEAIKKLQQGKDALNELLGDRLLRECRTEKETLLREMAYLRKIEELEDHRAKLEDGKPCPLCGSKEHPFAEENVPVPDEIEQKIKALTNLITKAEDLDAANKKLGEREAVARKNLNDSEKLETGAVNDKKAAEKKLTELKDELEKLQFDFKELKQAVSNKLQPLGISVISDADVSSLLESLKSRLNAWKDQVKNKVEIEKQIAHIDSDIKRLNAVIETQSDALTEKQENLELLKKQHAAGMDERRKLYGDKTPNDEEDRLHKAIVDAEDIEKKARGLDTELQKKLTTAKTHVESLKKRIERREPELKKAETNFSLGLQPAGFSDEVHFLEARLPFQQREELAVKAKKLSDHETDLKARQRDRETRLATEMTKKVTIKSLDDLEPQFKEYEKSLKEMNDLIAGLKHKLSENTAAKERIKIKQTTIEAQKKECRRWENLHELIGSSDGKKYRNFAQGLTFEMMVGHANRQLQKMTDRYLLIRDDAQPLELNVVDSYQGGEIRSTKNLSGGESFIVSLSLALGLSNMASKNVRVDSLFLDEGFGTLDDEALDTALETLASLQQDGKLIGVISHVPALKERINAQIQVTPKTGGRSQISGPGCNRSTVKDQAEKAG